MSTPAEWKKNKSKSLGRLKAMAFEFADYAPPSAEWDHDHCEGCWAKFARFDAPGILHSGYFTIVQIRSESTKEPEFIRQARESGRHVLAKPDTKQWVCSECFEAFRIKLAWKLQSKPSL